MRSRPANKKRIVLLDSHAIIHRAYHALPDFTSPTGEPTGALYGLSSMLIRIIDELRPDYLVACYDLPKPTIRHEAYAEYKGTRTKTDDALVAQLKSSRELFKAFCIPIYDREGFEADDILGTIAYMLRDNKDVEVIIASGDMDTLQLVEEDRVKVYTLKKGINDTILYNEKAVTDRFGFHPTLIPDWKGLRGDPSDNIKGIPGIGEKIATDLVVNFGSIEDIYAKLKKSEEPFLKKGIKPRIIELLKKHEEDARFSKMLAMIRVDAPISFSLNGKTYMELVQPVKIQTIFDELGFRSLRGRLNALFDDDLNPEVALAEEMAEEDIPDHEFREAQVMLWLLVSDFTNPSTEDIIAYTKSETFAEAHKELEKELAKIPRLWELYESIERPLVEVLEEMERYGVLVNAKELEKLKIKYQKDLEAIEKKIFEHAGHEFNVSSPKQLGVVLFDELNLVAKGQKKTAGGQRSTRESELEKITDLHPIVADILEYRELQKLLSTYIESIPPLLDSENRLHAHFIQTGTTTGRMASQNPNLQNIPIRTDRGRAIRNAFVAPKGFVLAALDYSQIELRIAAILSEDQKLGDIFRSGRDVHTEVASAVFGVAADKVDREMRRRAKIINFGILYGMGVNALRTQLGTTTAEAHQFYEDYFVTFKTLSEFMESTKGFARKHGYTETMFGRRRQFPEMKSPLPYVRAQAERMAINAPIQGTQSDIIKAAMVQVDTMFKTEKIDGHLLLQVHDELVYEVPEDNAKETILKIQNIMESVLPLSKTLDIPLKVDAKRGEDWGTLEPV